MKNAIKYGKVVLVLLLFVTSIVLITWDGAPHYRTGIALLSAAIGGVYAHKWSIGKV